MNELATTPPLPRPVPVWHRVGAWLAGGSLAELPGHVQRELDDQRRRNEILVGWIQASLVLVSLSSLPFRSARSKVNRSLGSP